jgi:hypothetical protein
MHRQNADAHHRAAQFRRQREMAAADLEADQAGQDGDRQRDRDGEELKAAIQRRIEREDRNEGRGPQSSAGADGSHEQPADAGRALRGAGAGKVAHADPCAEQADGARNHDQDLVDGKHKGSGFLHARRSCVSSYAWDA